MVAICFLSLSWAALGMCVSKVSVVSATDLGLKEGIWLFHSGSDFFQKKLIIFYRYGYDHQQKALQNVFSIGLN